MNTSALEPILSDLGQELGIDGFALKDGDSVDLLLEEDLLINLAREDDQSRIRITCELGNWPNLGDEFLRLLLKSNDPDSTSSITMAMRAGDDSLMAVTCVSYADLTLDALRQGLTNMIASCQAWARLLSEGVGTSPADSAEDNPSTQAGLRV